VAIIQNFALEDFPDLPLPPKIIKYLLFKPEFD
jgi:hypothetical protein